MSADVPRRAAHYVHGHHEAVLRSHTWRTAANSAGYLLPELAPGQSVLDVGCGPGTITADLAERVAPGEVTGVDAADGVLVQARTTAAERGLTNLTFAVADVHRLDFPDDSFDVVHAHQVLQHVTDPVGALREMRRVCRPGGVVAARDADYAAMTWYPQVPGLDDWLATYRTVARASGGEPDAGRQLRAWAGRAGFTEVTSTATAWCYATDEERSWWSGLWADRTLSAHYRASAVPGGHVTEAGLLAAAEAWRQWGRAADGWFAVLHGEILCRA